MEKMTDLFKVGEWFYGFCGGYFGTNFKRKQCVFVARNYAVFEYYDTETAVVLNKEDCLGLDRKTVKKWSIGNSETLEA